MAKTTKTDERTSCMERAAQQSQLGEQRFVVYVPDDCRYDVFNAEQCRRWAPLIFIEATFVAGQMVSDVRAIGESMVRS